MKPPTCTWDTDRGWLMPEHVRDCDDAGCDGCKPCPKSHCALKGHCPNHVETAAGIYTCPSCIGKVRSDVAAIVELQATAMPDEAMFAGVESEAFNLLGPAASVDQTYARRHFEDGLRGWCEYPRPDDPHHPYAVLGRWDLALREDYGPQTDLFVTVASAASFLAKLLDGPFPHTTEFEQFAHEVAACRRHLEDVAHDGVRAEEGARCPTCGDADGKAPRLRKRYARGTDAKTLAGENDTWHCPADPKHWWTEYDYRTRVARTYVEHAPELPITELAERLAIPPSTLRRWAGRRFLRLDEVTREPVYSEPKLKPCGRAADGRRLYRVADALRVSLDIKTLDVSKSG